MPRKRTPLPALVLTPADHAFIDRAEATMHLLLDRLQRAAEAIQPVGPTLEPDYDRPAPATKLSYTFVPYGRELLRFSRSLQTLCDLWAILKSLRTQAAQPGDAETAPAVCGPNDPQPPDPITAATILSQQRLCRSLIQEAQTLVDIDKARRRSA